MKKLSIAITAIISCMIGAWLHSALSQSLGSKDKRTAVIVDTIRYVDTIVYEKPVAMKEKQRTIGYKKMNVAKHSVIPPDSMLPKIRDETAKDDIIKEDSITLEMPIEQKVYETPNYKAYVSGIDARLDSIRVYSRTETLRIREPPKRWHIGLTAGCGMTAKGVQPYVGIGVTYSIFSF